MAKGRTINIIHANEDRAMVEIDGALYWMNLELSTMTMAVLPSNPPSAASISLISGQPIIPVSV